MEDKNSEQTIDQPPSTSEIDQITKLPESRPKEKVKNPKRVAAGKKLSEYNRKARKSREAVVKEQQVSEEDSISEKNSWLPETSFTTVITVFGLGLSAIDLFLRYKSQKDFSNIDEKVNEKPVENPVETDYEDVTKIKAIPKTIRGME